MTASELADTLTTIASQTKALRDAGVVGRVTIGDVSFEIGEVMGPAPTSTPEAASTNPLDDGDTYGGFIPQRRVFVAPSAPTESNDDDD